MAYAIGFLFYHLLFLYLPLGFLSLATGPICLASFLYLHFKGTDRIKLKQGLFITSLAFFSLALVALNMLIVTNYKIESCTYFHTVMSLILLSYLASIFFNLKFLVLELKRKEEKSKTYIFYSLSLLIIFLPHILVAATFTNPYKCGLPF